MQPETSTCAPLFVRMDKLVHAVLRIFFTMELRENKWVQSRGPDIPRGVGMPGRDNVTLLQHACTLQSTWHTPKRLS